MESITRSAALCSQAHLCDRLLAARVQHRARAGDRRRDLQQQGRFADPRVATEEDHRSRHDAAPEDPIELLRAGGNARCRRHRGNTATERDGLCSRRGASARGSALLERIPLAAQRTLTLPFQGFAPA